MDVEIKMQYFGIAWQIRFEALSYNITGDSAPIFFQSKKCPQKHGGFRPLLTPYGSSGSGYLPLTNRDPTIKIKSFTPQFFCTIFYLFFWLLNLLSKIVEKVVVYA